MIRFHFEIDPSTQMSYYAIRLETGETLYVVNLVRLAALPTWLREHLANGVAEALDPKTPASQRTNVIDITDARQAREIRESFLAAGIGG